MCSSFQLEMRKDEILQVGILYIFKKFQKLMFFLTVVYKKLAVNLLFIIIVRSLLFSAGRFQ